MGRLIILVALALSSVAEARVMGWLPVSRQTHRLEPGRWQAAGHFGPGPIHLNVRIRAGNAVNIGVVRASDWDQGRKGPMQCQARGLVNSTFTCDLDMDERVVLLLQDVRLPSDAIASVITSGIRNAAIDLVSSNEVTLSFLEWGCIRNCYAKFAWKDVSKEKFDLFQIAKTYGPITPEYDGTEVRVKLKSKVPMLVAVLPVAVADQVRANPATAEPLLAGAPCKQRAVQKADFTCKLQQQDGPQQVVLVPEPGISVPTGKKVEVQVSMVRCVANCAVE